MAEDRSYEPSVLKRENEITEDSLLPTKTGVKIIREHSVQVPTRSYAANAASSIDIYPINIVSYTKPSSLEHPTYASTSNVHFCPENTEITSSSSQPTQSLTLAQHGIKVRDFAFEPNTLPPILPVPRLPRQVQPNIRPLKRARRADGDDEDDDPLPPFLEGSPPRAGPSQPMAGGVDTERDMKKSKPLERKITEPVDENSQTHPMRARGFVDFSRYQSSFNTAPFRSYTPLQFREKHLVVDPHFSSPSSQPALHFTSQESEPYVDTPLVTPNGSLQWTALDNSVIPASQLDTESQVPVPEILSYSQLGFTLPESQADDPFLRDTSPIRPSSPISEVPSTPPLPPVNPSDEPSRMLPSAASPLRSTRYDEPVNMSPIHKSDVQASAASPRYFLRARPGLSPSSPSRTRRGRTILSPGSSQSLSVQADCSKKGPPQPRTLRKGIGKGGKSVAAG